MVLETATPVQSPLITDSEVLTAYTEDASSFVGSPTGLLRPASASEASWWLAEAASRGQTVTPCGLRSSTTGAGLSVGGWTMSCEALEGVVDVDEVRKTAVVQSGTVLSDFKRQVEGLGLFYPPDPTSEGECSVGGTVACDASGARSYRYGSTHRWLLGVEVALLDGSVRWFRRRSAQKDAAGYAALRDLVGVICGSEGTLGFITKAEVQLLDRPDGFVAGLAFFDRLEQALSFVAQARGQDQVGSGVRPRALELLDEGSLQIMEAHSEAVCTPPGVTAGIFFEEEHRLGEQEGVVDAWLALLQSCPGARVDDTIVATSSAQQAALRSLRHAVPSVLNEEGRTAAAQGGRKISTDWAVPFDALAAMMQRVDGWVSEAGLRRVLRYGHIGSGHPHYNLIAQDGCEATRAEELVDRMCREACSLGGTIAAEHGVGKLKRRQVNHRFDALDLSVMRAVKGVFDPQGLLAPGNLFPDVSES